jgi:thiosulfate/3-mercaptopyruvate sulfurtransferase
LTYQTLVSVETLNQHLHQEDWAIFDCRFDLQNAEWGYQSYQQSHIPGAVYAHLDRDLSAPITPESGRHPLPGADEIARRFSAWGISPSTQVVVYDTAGGAYASRLWWMLRFMGHERAAVLNGGFQKWQEQAYPLASGTETRQPAQFQPRPDLQLAVSTTEVAKIMRDPDYSLIDARAPERHRGEREPIDTVAGHIPGSVNRFHGANLGPDGLFLPPDVLRAQFLDLIGSISPEKVIVYCGSGVTSCHHILAMETAGLPGARLYTGSWSEWIRDRKRPISP